MAAPAFTKIVNLTGETLYIHTAARSVAVPPDPCSPAADATGAPDECTPLRLDYDGTTFTFGSWTLDGALRQEGFRDPDFVERTRSALVVARPEHARTIASHLCRYAADDPRVVCVVGTTLGSALGAPLGRSVERGFFTKLA